MKWHENRHKQQFNIVDCNGLYKLLNRLKFKMASFKRYNRIVMPLILFQELQVSNPAQLFSENIINAQII
jgi:hypothetical protein